MADRGTGSCNMRCGGQRHAASGLQNEIGRRELLGTLAAGAGLLLLRCDPGPQPHHKLPPYDWNKQYWGFAVDTNACIGCCACMRACKAENDVPDGSQRTWIERYRIDKQGKVSVDLPRGPRFTFAPLKGEVDRAFFVPKLCNHCSKSVCSQVCPVGASYQSKDGVVLVDKQRCVGCGYCVQACPYGTRFINPRDHLADKCTLCYHRITRGMQPACVEACPREARIFGDLKDPKSKLSTLLKQQHYALLRPELGTHPKCYYLGLDREVI